MRKRFRKRINKMIVMAREIGLILTRDSYAIPSLWLKCALYDTRNTTLVKEAPMFEMEHYLQKCCKLKAFL